MSSQMIRVDRKCQHLSDKVDFSIQVLIFALEAMVKVLLCGLLRLLPQTFFFFSSFPYMFQIHDLWHQSHKELTDGLSLVKV